MSKEKLNIFSTAVSTGSFDHFLERIMRLPGIKPASYVCFANVHMIIEAYKDRDARAAINNADLVAPDGKPISVFLNAFHGLNQEKVSGPDIFPRILKQAADRGLKVFFYGSTETVLNKVAARAKEEHPGIIIAGTYAPPFREMSSREKGIVADLINRAAPHFVFVALGCPKQEKWMAENCGKISGCMLGIGQAFQVYAKELKRAPKLVQDLGFEWAYRLALEPGRLWKRYLKTNSIFLLLTVQYGIRNIFKKVPG